MNFIKNIKAESESLKMQGAAHFIGQVSAFLIQYLTLLILVRILSTLDYGVFQQFNLLITTLMPIFGFTFVSSLFYFFPISNNIDKNSYIIQTYLLLIASGLLLILIFAFFKNELLVLLNFKELNELDWWIFISVGLFLTSSIAENIFILEKKILLMVLFPVLEKGSYLLLIIGISLTSKDYKGAIVGYGIYVFLKITFINIYIYLNYFRAKRFFIKKENVIKQLKYSGPFYLGILVYTISQKFDKIFINQYISPKDYAIYSVSFLSIPLLSNLVSSINNVSIPRYSDMYMNKDLAGIIELYKKIFATTSAIVIPIVIFFFIFADKIIIVLFTARFEAAIPLYRIYILTFLFYMTSFGLILRAANQTKKIFYTNLFTCIVAVITGMIIIPKFGLYGGVITATIAFILPAIIQLSLEAELLQVSLLKIIPFKIVIKILLMSVLILPLLYLMQNIIKTPTFFLLASFTVYIFVISICEYKLGLLPFVDKIKIIINKYSRI